MNNFSELDRQLIEEAQLNDYVYEPDFDCPCPECGGSGITICYASEPQGDGTYLQIQESCICPICQ